MDFVGVISAASDPPGIDQQRWIDTIPKHPALAPFLPKRRINPFTKQPQDFLPDPAAARILLEGKDVGWMGWSQSDTNEVIVYGPADLVRTVAHEIAALLGATYTEEPPAEA